MEMTNEKNNQEEDKEIRQSRVWDGRAMNGTWDGNGIWYTNNQWTGIGTWHGGMLSGTWDVKGTWEGDGNGEWKGDGKFVCNVKFARYVNIVTYIVVFITTIVAAALKLFVNAFEGITTIIIVAIIGAIAIVGYYFAQDIDNGKMWLKGTWKDDGEFRILEMGGKWKLGIHKGTIRGKMKDPKHKDPKHKVPLDSEKCRIALPEENTMVDPKKDSVDCYGSKENEPQRNADL